MAAATFQEPSRQTSNESSSSSARTNPRDRIREPTNDPSNPYGLGDPSDQTLRKVEKDIMIPMKMRDKAKATKCQELVKKFHDCCLESGLLMVVKCRRENESMKECLTKWYNDEGFIKQCTEEYLQERSEYRRTGVKKKEMKKYTG